MLESQTGPSLVLKMFKYSVSPLSQSPYLELFRSRGGPVEDFFFFFLGGGGSQETFSGEAQLRKTTLYDFLGPSFNTRTPF